MNIRKISVLVTVVLFSAVLFLGCALTLTLPKKAVSESERRTLAELPEFTVQTVMEGTWFSEISDYLTDHFALREELRTVNAAVRLSALQQPDVEGVLEADGYLFQPTWPLDEKVVTANAQKLQSIAEVRFPDKPIYFSVIPEKSDYASLNRPCLDTNRVVELVSQNLSGQYIDITGTLELSDYYRTDTHWQQEKLEDTAAALVAGMGGTLTAPEFVWQTAGEPFYGVLWGRYAMPVPGEDLIYGTNAATENAAVRYTDHPEWTGVYVKAEASLDDYDLFLGGAQSVIEMTNENAATDKHLILFRDSFGSSLAPWLLTQYEKITIIDIRYATSEDLREHETLAHLDLSRYADLESADEVLFLYSTSILNTGGILK